MGSDAYNEFRECCACEEAVVDDRGNRVHDHDCILCEDAPAVDGLGYCGPCHWILRAECEKGFRQLREYLRAWAKFGQWCAEHGFSVTSP